MGQTGTQTETGTPRPTDLGGGHPLGVPLGLQAGRGREGAPPAHRWRGKRAPPSRVRINGDVPVAGEGPDGRGSAPPPLPARPLRAGPRCRSAPAPTPPHPRALLQSPLRPQSQRRRRPLPPSQPLRLAQLGDAGRGTFPARWDEGYIIFICLGSPKSATLVPSRNSGTPLEKWFLAPPRRTPESRAGAGSTPRGDSQALGRPFEAMADFGGFRKLILWLQCANLEPPTSHALGAGTSQANGSDNSSVCTVDAQ